LEAWRYAQAEKTNPIPEEKAKYMMDVLMPLIEVNLSTMLENGDIYVCGSKAHFAWLEQARINGKKGGEASAKKRKGGSSEKGRGLTPKTIGSTNINNINNIKNINKEKAKKKKFSSADQLLAEKWISNLNPNGKCNDKQCDAVRLLREQDGVNLDQLEAALSFVKGDDFWMTKATTPLSLRMVGKNGNKKIVNILNQMEAKPKEKQTYGLGEIKRI
jgi:hypothetical protein